MSETRDITLGLPPGVTVIVYPLDAEQAQAILQDYPHMADKIESIVVISGLPARKAAQYSREIQGAIWAQTER